MRIATLGLLLASSVAFAGNLPAGAACSNPNDCVSHTCSQKRCAPSGDHPGGLGAVCTSNGHCKSRNCVSKSCAAPKEVKAPATKGGSGKTSAPVAEEDEEVAAPQPPKEEPLPTPTACADDLLATVYKDSNGSRAARFHADDECKRNRPETLARAKELFLAGYGNNFAYTVKAVKEGTPEQLECAKKQYDKTRDPKDPRRFEIPSLCKQSQGAINCIEDLAAVLKGDTDSAKRECERRTPEVLAIAKELVIDGIEGSFANICDTVEATNPDQLECMKRNYEYLTNGRTKYAGFTQNRLCKGTKPEMDCYFELMSIDSKELQSNDRNRDDNESACRKVTPEAVELTKKMRAAGFMQWTSSMARTISDAKPEQRACLKKAKPSAFTAAEKAESNFRIPKACQK